MHGRCVRWNQINLGTPTRQTQNKLALKLPLKLALKLALTKKVCAGEEQLFTYIRKY